MALLVADNLGKTYTGGETAVTALSGVSFSLAPGDFVAVMGPSGCGKSTLLHLCGAMDRPSTGRLLFENRDLAMLEDDELTRVRRERVGFVFQFFNLLPTLTLADNIALPRLLAGVTPKEAEASAHALAARVGIADRLHHYPAQVSGGEMQRAAIARALAHRPALVIADEPTGNLDSDNGARVLALLEELNRETGVTILLATHAPEVAAAASRVLWMRDGRIVDASGNPEGLPPHVSGGDRADNPEGLPPHGSGGDRADNPEGLPPHGSGGDRADNPEGLPPHGSGEDRVSGDDVGATLQGRPRS